MAVRVAINGFGRIGRLVFRAMAARPNEFEVVAFNDLSDAATLGTLLKYDSVHGRFDGTVEVAGNDLAVNGNKIKMLQVRNPAELPWADLGVVVAVEATGVFRERESAKGGYGDHLKAGAKKVVLTAPAKDEPDLTVVIGVNDDQIKPEQTCFSNASCTTNCLAPMAKVLQDNFGIVKGLMTTIHAFTNDQRVLDLIHRDLYRARAAALNIIPTTTGAAKAVGKVIPELRGKLTGIAMRVPVPDGSVTDLTVELARKATAEEINAAMKKAAEGPLAGIVEYTEDPLVSSDIIGNPHSCVFAAPHTTVIQDTMAKVIGWYDNEWAYSMRTADLVAKIASV